MAVQETVETSFTLPPFFLWACVVVSMLCVCMRVEAMAGHWLASSISFRLAALRQGLSLIQTLVIAANQQIQGPPVSEFRFRSLEFQGKFSH